MYWLACLCQNQLYWVKPLRESVFFVLISDFSSVTVNDSVIASAQKKTWRRGWQGCYWFIWQSQQKNGKKQMYACYFVFYRNAYCDLALEDKCCFIVQNLLLQWQVWKTPPPPPYTYTHADTQTSTLVLNSNNWLKVATLCDFQSLWNPTMKSRCCSLFSGDAKWPVA